MLQQALYSVLIVSMVVLADCGGCSDATQIQHEFDVDFEDGAFQRPLYRLLGSILEVFGPTSYSTLIFRLDLSKKRVWHGPQSVEPTINTVNTQYSACCSIIGAILLFD